MWVHSNVNLFFVALFQYPGAPPPPVTDPSSPTIPHRAHVYFIFRCIILVSGSSPSAADVPSTAGIPPTRGAPAAAVPSSTGGIPCSSWVPSCAGISTTGGATRRIPSTTGRRCERRHSKRSLMAWVVVIPKEGWAHVLWHRLFRFFLGGGQTFLYFFINFFTKKSVSNVRMTTTQAIRELFAWRHLCCILFGKCIFPHKIYTAMCGIVRMCGNRPGAVLSSLILVSIGTGVNTGMLFCALHYTSSFLMLTVSLQTPNHNM